MSPQLLPMILILMGGDMAPPIEYVPPGGPDIADSTSSSSIGLAIRVGL